MHGAKIKIKKIIQTIFEYLFYAPEKAHYIAIRQLSVLSTEVTKFCS
jgi:hypothetical protein